MIAQTPPQQPQQQTEPDEVIRITSELVQTDAVVTDKNDHIIPDLKINDFELYENGKRQGIKFLEFVSADSGRRIEGKRPGVLVVTPESVTSPGVAVGELRRVFAFVVDDLTLPYQDIPYVRQMLSEFVDNQMREGDLVAFVRVIGGKGLLQQFTSDRQLLRRAIASIMPRPNPYSAFENVPFDKSFTDPSRSKIGTETGNGTGDINPSEISGFDLDSTSDNTQRALRSLNVLSTASYVIESLQEIPGRKTMVLVSGGLPVLDIDNTGTVDTTVSYLIQILTNNAVRAGVAINTLDARGLNATRAVAKFADTPGRSSLGGAVNSTFGRGGGDQAVFGSASPFGISNGQLGLQTLSSATGGVSVQNTNDFQAGLGKIVARSNGYYLLAYTPSEKFDGKFHKIQIKVKRGDAKIYTHSGYIARETTAPNAPRTKEETIAAAARSPLAKRDVDISANLSFRLNPNNKAAVGINMLIDAKKLNFAQTVNGKYQTSFDVVGFVFDQLGKLRGGFSETVTANLSHEDYEHALKTGLSYSANTELPPGYFQFRAVVREANAGGLGTFSKYFEIPDLSKKRLAASSIFLYSVEPSSSNQAMTIPMLASREISRSRDLRYALAVYNPKLDKGGKPQLRSQLIISQGTNVLFKEPEQSFEVTSNNTSQLSRVGQIGLSKVKPGRYVLTMLITDPLADKKEAVISRSIDFTVVN